MVLEHVRSPIPAVRAVQRVLDLFTSTLQGDHQLSEPMEHVRAEGFEVVAVERSKLGIIKRVIAQKPDRDPGP